MVYTLTVNPSVDYVLSVPVLKRGYINRPDSEYVFAGGRGINIAIMLKEMGIDSVALGFLGGFTGSFIKNVLKRVGITDDFTEIDGESRINLKIISDDCETEINAKGPWVGGRYISHLLAKLEVLKEGDYMFLSGSAERDEIRELYKEVGRLCNERSVKMIINADGQTFKEMLAYKPFFIKPSYRELGIMFDTTILTNEAVYNYGKKAIELGAENVIVTMAGQDGEIYFNKDTVLKSDMIKQKPINTNGIGDSIVAGFAGEYMKSGDYLRAFKVGVSAGRATSQVARLCSYELMLKFSNGVDITEYTPD